MDCEILEFYLLTDEIVNEAFAGCTIPFTFRQSGSSTLKLNKLYI